MCLKSRKEIKNAGRTNFGKTYARVRRFCFSHVLFAEDATQETFIKAMKSYDSFLHNSNEKTWLIRIAINSCKNIMRTKWFRFPMMNVDDQQYIADDHSIEEVVKKDSSSNLSYFNAWGNNSSS